MGDNMVELGLLLRNSILVNSLLFTSETWSNIKEEDIKRLEQVDQSLLNHLVSGHSKSPLEFVYLETGSLKLRCILTQNRLMFHHHLLGLDENETLKKIYVKQKKETTKGDWFQLLKEDFTFIEEVMDENKIKLYSKEEYKRIVKKLVRRAAFQYLIKERIVILKLKKYSTLNTKYNHT